MYGIYGEIERGRKEHGKKPMTSATYKQKL